jgi:hypothetical protein
LVRDIDQLVALAGPDSQPWVPSRTDHVVRIKTERITGRRIEPGLRDRRTPDSVVTGLSRR